MILLCALLELLPPLLKVKWPELRLPRSAQFFIYRHLCPDVVSMNAHRLIYFLSARKSLAHQIDSHAPVCKGVHVDKMGIERHQMRKVDRQHWDEWKNY